MMEDDVSRFWQRVETVKPGSWKELADSVGVDFELMMTQKSMNRLPRIADLCHFAKRLHTSVEWLVSGYESESAAALRLGSNLDVRMKRIIEALENADESLLQKVESLIQSSIT
jgi:transcriptional regulator with XRE-family HTH domain